MSDTHDIRVALESLPELCKYHGGHIETYHPGTIFAREYSGACCATGEASLLRRRALAALDRLSA